MEDIASDKRTQLQKYKIVEFTVSQELLWLWRGDGSGTQERDRSPFEAGTRGLVKGQQTEETQCV
jgi:hypothetical protein